MIVSHPRSHPSHPGSRLGARGMSHSSGLRVVDRAARSAARCFASREDDNHSAGGGMGGEAGMSAEEMLRRGMERYDAGEPAAAVEWFRRAAERGLAAAQYALGAAHDEGAGVPQNHAAAAKWFRRAAEQGDAVAQLNLGIMLAKGEGVAQDCAEAVAWVARAAEQGIPEAQQALLELARE